MSVFWGNEKNSRGVAQVSFHLVESHTEHLVASARCSERYLRKRFETGDEPMKKTMTSSLRMVVAAAAAFVASVSVTACVTSGEGDAAATEQVAENNNAATADENVAANNETASGDNLASLNGEANVNDSNLSLNGENTAAAGEGADPFAAALNNAAQPANDLSDAALANDPATPAENPAQTAGANLGAGGNAGELQTLVSESASGAATTPPSSGSETEGVDPFAAPANNTASQAASNTTIPNPETATDDASLGALPEMGTLMPYYVQKGDTLGDIAATIYGDKSQWRRLAEENNLKDPSLIYAGDVILYTLSEKSKAFASAYESAALKSVTVAKGDTLSSLAAKVLGSSQEWRTLWKMNAKIANPDSIEVGMVLTYRKSESSVASTAEKGATDEVSGEEAQEASVETDPVFVSMAE